MTISRHSWRVICDVRSRASRLRRAWFNAANHAFTRLRIHDISCFKVTFHLLVQFLGAYSAAIPYRYTGEGSGCETEYVWGYLYGLDSGIPE